LSLWVWLILLNLIISSPSHFPASSITSPGVGTAGVCEGLRHSHCPGSPLLKLHQTLSISMTTSHAMSLFSSPQSSSVSNNRLFLKVTSHHNFPK
jgi:hypothetical protein